MKSTGVFFIFLILAFSSLSFATGVKTYTLNGGTWKPLGKNPSKASSPSSTIVTPMVYVYIQYTKVAAHVDMPGEWMFGNVRITTIASNASLMLNFSTSGNLSNGLISIPTYYKITNGQIPQFPLSEHRWTRASALNGYQFFPCSHNSMWLWMGVKVNEETPKGKYKGWIEISVAQAP